jgi:hypothetical protein
VTIVERGGPLGPVLDGLQNRWSDAVAWLRHARTGDARGVLSHPDVPAPIDVVWGDAHGGLAHILARHPGVVDVLPDRLARLRVVERTENRIHLSDDEYVAVISLNHLDAPKTWLLTAFEGVHRPRSRRGSMGSPPELRGPLTSRAAPGEPNVSPEGGGVETSRNAAVNFRRLAADSLPHNEPDLIAASRAAAARWEDERTSDREPPGAPPAASESTATPEPAAESAQTKESGIQPVEEMLARKAALAELLEHPEIKAGYEAQKNRQPTDKLAGFKTPEFQTKRKVNINGKTVEGYDAAVKYLVEGAKAFSTKGPVKNEGTATIVLGPPAAGKSTFSERLARERYAAIVDSDEAKKIIPEYDGGAGVNAVNAESSRLRDLVAGKLYDENANLVFPKVGADTVEIRRLIKTLDRRGYQVDLVHINVSPDEAFRRMIGRYKERLIPAEYLNKVGDRPRQTYYLLKKEGHVHEAVEIDANGAPGKHLITDGADTELASYLRPE